MIYIITVVLFNLKAAIKIKRIVKNSCVFALYLVMFMAIHPDKASAYSCGSEYDGYVCCNSYHAFGHDNYLTTINRTIIGTKYIKIDSGFNNSQTATINNVINSWNLQLACLSKEPTIENYIDDADIIIKGEVISIKYFECNGIPWSKLNILVKKLFQEMQH